jgi:putative cell wall-binding protein
MTRRIFGRAAAATLTVALMVAVFGATASAAQAPIAPMSIYRSGFGTPDAAQTIKAYTLPSITSSAYWGVLPTRGISGSYGLWCAGSPITPTTLGWPTYPVGTRSLMTVDMSQLADWYASRLDVSYNQPSLGDADGESLQMGWMLPGDPLNVAHINKKDVHSEMPLTAASSWTTTSWPMSAQVAASAPDKVNLSRTAGALIFVFSDSDEGYGQNKLTGQGPTLDNVVVTGYKYGPVRGLAAPVASGVHLSWQRPLASTYATAGPEERTISYRVWRKKAAEKSWTELTSSSARLADGTLSYPDASGVSGDKYLVQAWDPSGEGYGQPAGAVAGSGSTACLALTVTGKASPGLSPTYSYRVTNIGQVTATTVAVKDGVATIGSIGSLRVGDSAVFARAATAGTVGGVATCTQGGNDSVSSVVNTPSSRLAGADRYATAVATSQRGFPGSFNSSGAVVITGGTRWQEPLLASSLAGAVHGPLLLVTKSGPLLATVTAELKRLKPNKVYIVGGTTMVDATAVAAITAVTGVTPERIDGGDVYNTARKVAQKVVSLTSVPAGGRKVFLATDGNFPDALAASSLAAAYRAPILLTPIATLSSVAQATISSDVHPTEVVVCGGTGAVSDAAAVAAAVAAGLGSSGFTRLGGGTRYDTADLIARYGVAKSGLPKSGTVFVATGTNFPDALAGGVLAGTVAGRWQPMVLTSPLSLSPQVTGFLADFRELQFDTVLGGTGAVSAVAERGVVAALP